MKSEKDSAHILAPPPIFFIAGMLIGGAIHFFYPVHLLLSPYSIILAFLFLWASIPLIIFSLKAFFKVKTAFDARKTKTILVTTGIYKISRNPAYLSLVFFHMGISLLVNSLWILIMLAPIIFILQKYVIEREEKYLSEKFGSRYLAYKDQVRRWFFK